MEGIRDLNLNVNVTIYSPGNRDRDSKLSPQMFIGRIYSREANQNVIIELEIDRDADVPSPGKPILLFLAHDLGLYIFSAIISRTFVANGRITIHCSRLDQIKYFQRRNSVRVNVNIPVNFSAEFNRSSVWEGTITNISIGGLQLEAPFSIPPDLVLELVYQLEDIGPLYMDGKVIRSFEKNGRCVHGIQFFNPDRLHIDGIARFVMAEQMRQKRLGLNFFKAFMLKATVRSQVPTVFSIIQYKNLDVTALQGKKCSGIINEIGIRDLAIECPLRLPVGAVLEFSMDLPKMGYSSVKAVVSEVKAHLGKFLVRAEFAIEYEDIRDHVLELLARDVELPYVIGEG